MSFLESTVIFILEFFNKFAGSYGISIISLSIFLSIILIPLYHITSIFEKKERNIKQKLDIYITKINTIKDKATQHKQLKELYRSFSYYPFYALRSLSSLFIQIPVLVIVYRALNSYAPLNAEGFWPWASNLGQPDHLFLGLNLFPIIMTALNIGSVYLSSEPNSKERRQGIFIAMIFFVLLYNLSSALLIYWTFNQAFNFIRYAVKFNKEKRILQFNFKFKYEKQPKTLFNVVLALCTMAFPAFLYFKNNIVYFIDNDAIIYFSVLFGAAILLSLLFSHVIVLTLILTFMFFPIINHVTIYYGNAILMRILIFGVFLYFCTFLKKQKILLCIFFASASIYVIFGIYQNYQYRKTNIANTKIEIPKDLLDLPLKDSSSIYLFLQDGFPHQDYADYLKLPDYNELMNILKLNDFNIYNVYSMASHTLATMSSVFDINASIIPKSKNQVPTDVSIATTFTYTSENLDMYRLFTSGNNKSNLLLQENGYQTGFVTPFFQYMMSNENNFYNFEINLLTTKIKNKMLKAIALGYLNSGIFRIKVRDDASEFTEFITKYPLKDNLFAWYTSGPGHSTDGALGGAEAEIADYTTRYIEAIQGMKTKILAAVKNNPNAIIIFMSDHGGFLIDDGLRFPPNYDFNKTDYMKFRDIFGAFMAIRFPDKERAAKYDKDFNVVQDLFPIVFAYLFDSEIPLKYKIQNTEVQIGPHKFDKGVFYRDFYK
ncbi:MAG: YidC/Oxa1 family membrane protein insertase [Fibromonadales bacterium]|nr:YidC/Oxa1 family membrane protein insertase [Fibromonadales bacterium]